MNAFNVTTDVLHERVVCIWLGSSQSDRARGFAEALYRLSPKVALRREGESDVAVFVHVQSREWSSVFEARLLHKIAVLARRLKLLPLRTYVAPHAGMAWAGAKWGIPEGKSFWEALPIESLTDVLAPFGVFGSPWESAGEWSRVLRLLGIHTLDRMMALPTEMLASRLGKRAVEASRHLKELSTWGFSVRTQAESGNLHHDWPKFIPDERMVEKIALDPSDTSAYLLEGILFALKMAVDPCMLRLRGRGLRVQRIQVTLTLERQFEGQAPERVLPFDLVFAQSGTQALLQILHEKMAFAFEREPLDAPVTEIEFEVLETAPGSGAQRDLYDATEEENEALGALVERMNARLGVQDAVFQAEAVERWRPERAWQRVEPCLRAGRARDFEAAGAIQVPGRPSVLFKKPIPLRRIETDSKVWLVAEPSEGEAGERWEVSEWGDPERLSGEWWLDRFLRGFDRDYYRVRTTQGQQHWIFLRRGSADEYYWHGTFD